jgi:hypothetical protein
MQAGHQQSAFKYGGGCDPTDEWHQQHADGIIVQPQAQRVFLVADKAAALPSLERAPAQCGAGGGVLAGVFFEAGTGRRQIRGIH